MVFFEVLFFFTTQVVEWFCLFIVLIPYTGVAIFLDIPSPYSFTVHTFYGSFSFISKKILLSLCVCSVLSEWNILTNFYSSCMWRSNYFYVKWLLLIFDLVMRFNQISDSLSILNRMRWFMNKCKLCTVDQLKKWHYSTHVVHTQNLFSKNKPTYLKFLTN